jgi:hypothetical protein
VVKVNAPHRRCLIDPAPGWTHILLADNCWVLHSDLYVIDADGSESSGSPASTRERTAAFICYSSDGAKIVFIGPLDYRYAMDADGKATVSAPETINANPMKKSCPPISTAPVPSDPSVVAPERRPPCRRYGQPFGSGGS